MGGFNEGIAEKHMKCFCENNNFKSLIKQSTSYNNPDSPTCIDLLLTNAPRSTCILKTELPDFHLMTCIVMRKSYDLELQIIGPKKIYRTKNLRAIY